MRRQPLTLDELRKRDVRAYNAFMDFTEAQTMFWNLSVGPTGDFRAEDWSMGGSVWWSSTTGQWQ